MQSIFINFELLITFFNGHFQIILLIIVNLKFLFLDFKSNFIFVEAKYQVFGNTNYIHG